MKEHLAPYMAVRHLRRCVPLLAVLTVMAGCATTAPQKISATATGAATTIHLPLQLPQADAADAALLQRASESLRKGRAQQALDGPLATLAAHYQARYADDGVQHYCASSMPEAIVYLALAAQRGTDASLLPQLWADMFFLQGFALEDVGRLDDAEAALARAMALAPMNAHFLNEAGYNAQARKQWSRALDRYRRAKEAADSFTADSLKIIEQTRALRGQGFVLTETGRLDEAEAAYHQALVLDPRDRRAVRELRYIEQLRRTGHTSPARVYRDVNGASGG